jgi:hypothetical protein
VGADFVSAMELWIIACGILSRRSSVSADVSFALSHVGKTPRDLLTHKSFPDVETLGLAQTKTNNCGIFHCSSCDDDYHKL